VTSPQRSGRSADAGRDSVEALEQVAGRVGVIPIVASVVDDHVIAGIRARVRVLSTRSWLESSISRPNHESLVFVAHVVCGSHGPQRRGIRPRHFVGRNETRCQVLLPATREVCRAKNERIEAEAFPQDGICESSRTSATVE